MTSECNLDNVASTGSPGCNRTRQEKMRIICARLHFSSHRRREKGAAVPKQWESWAAGAALRLPLGQVTAPGEAVVSEADQMGASRSTHSCGLDRTARQLPTLLKWVPRKVTTMATRHPLVPETSISLLYVVFTF